GGRHLAAALSITHLMDRCRASVAHLGWRSDRLVIRWQRIARTEDRGVGLEGDLPDRRVIARECVAEVEPGGAVRSAYGHRLRQCADELEASGRALEELDLNGFRVAVVTDADGDLPGLSGTRRL